MSILDKLRTKPQQTDVVNNDEPIVSGVDTQLTLEEITWLLTAIKDLNFKVGDVELVYNTIVKLQSQFLALSEKPHKGK
jgi:hypothetical protein